MELELKARASFTSLSPSTSTIEVKPVQRESGWIRRKKVKGLR